MMEIHLGVLLTVASVFLLHDVMSEVDTDKFEQLMAKVERLQGSFGTLAKQTMAQQLFVEERIRSDGHSGVKQTRSYNHGTHSYFESSHINKAAALIHDHSHSIDLLGQGEVIVVLNGVEFRTRHNDYMIRRRSTTDTSYNAVEHVQYPKVPPEVLAQPNVAAQIKEMREWFKAFALQDYSVRDYRKYFRPLLCYMEGAWTLDAEISEPFLSTRHSLEARNWDQLRQQIQYTGYSGKKSTGENYSYLPTKIMYMNATTGEPVYGQWNYNVLCHPYSGDLPTRYLRQQDDLAYRLRNKMTMSRVNATRAARYRISEFDTPQAYTGHSILDKIMAEMPGKDNIPPFLNEEPIDMDILDPAAEGNVKLNTGYYHRMYRTARPGASGRQTVNRGFSDHELFFAETTQERVAPMPYRQCKNKDTCWDKFTRFSWAIPFELVYMTPLMMWNPFNITRYDDWKIPRGGGYRTGKPTPERALNGTSFSQNHYITPAVFFSNTNSDMNDPADDVQGEKGVLDQSGNVRLMTVSGSRIHLPNIPGVGSVRLRYSVFPVHGEGSTVWKDLEALRMTLGVSEDKGVPSRDPEIYVVKMAPSTKGDEHDHSLYLTVADYERVLSGEEVSVKTSLENGHEHTLVLFYNTMIKRISYKTCDARVWCFDLHPRRLDRQNGPDKEV